ncbi:hypothetical protein HMH01_14245 [Halovulum dunhuangense]|uniref:Uncharacterized protein n=1 Tax=Halovulum dunhuangense TaxID=1505036 RepID=A0A849L673_9RHOB|nr:hypothetical protein [Halovulum dunhuangense]NNU81597.1 hypothetical protein [Halovulum dunhuangense]
MFLYRSETEEAYEQDRRRVMEEIFRAVLTERHREICRLYGLPEDWATTPEPRVRAPLTAPRQLALPAPEAHERPKPPRHWNGPLRGR